jgi:hypothetical protein
MGEVFRDFMLVTPDVDMVKVAVGPPQRRLDVNVEGVELAVWDLDPPPDLGLRVEQGDLELVDGGGSLGGLRGGFLLGHGGQAPGDRSWPG